MTEETELATEVAGGEAVQPEAIEQKAEAAEALDRAALRARLGVG